MYVCKCLFLPPTRLSLSVSLSRALLLRSFRPRKGFGASAWSLFRPSRASISPVTSDRFDALPAFLDYRRVLGEGRKMTKIATPAALLFADVSRSRRAHRPRSSKTPRVSASFCAGTLPEILCTDRQFRNGAVYALCSRVYAPVLSRISRSELLSTPPHEHLRFTYTR